jgi:Ca2+-binding RTX toxin-like protein
MFVLAAFAGVWVVAVPPSWAGTIAANVADGILTVNGTTEGDHVTVRCESGRLTVNHDHPSGGPTACADLRRILVFAGEGPDRVSLVDVTPTAFDRLTATSVSGQLGDDALIGSEIRDDLIGGGGVDSLITSTPVRAGGRRSAARVAIRSRWPPTAIGRSATHDRGSCRPTRSRRWARSRSRPSRGGPEPT